MHVGWFVVLLVVLWGGAGCGSLSQEQADAPRAEREPEWAADEIRDHLRVFSEGLRVRGQTGDTVRTRTVEAYVAARLAEFKLQPGVAGTFRASFDESRHRVRHATIQRAGGMDTMSIASVGNEMMPDGRSAAGGALVRSVRAVEASLPSEAVRPVPPQQAVLLDAATATTERLSTLAQAGARTAFVVGPLTATRASRPVSELLVLQLTPATAARLTGRSVSTLRALMHDDAVTGTTWTLPEVLVVQVAAETTPATTATNVVGLIPGKHPTEAHQLVIVCAPLASPRRIAGMNVVHPQRLGAGAAAVLEAVRHLSYYARYWPLPERTVLVAFWSDEVDPLDGLRAYLDTPLWSLDRTVSVIYVGPAGDDLERVQDLFAPTGVPVHAVPVPTDSLGPDAPLLVRDGRIVGQPGVVVDNPLALWQEAVPAALDAARATYGLLAQQAVTPSLILPVHPDSLPTPAPLPNTP